MEEVQKLIDFYISTDVFSQETKEMLISDLLSKVKEDGDEPESLEMSL